MTRFGIVLTVVAAGMTAAVILFLRNGLDQVSDSDTGWTLLTSCPFTGADHEAPYSVRNSLRDGD